MVSLTRPSLQIRIVLIYDGPIPSSRETSFRTPRTGHSQHAAQRTAGYDEGARRHVRCNASPIRPPPPTRLHVDADGQCAARRNAESRDRCRHPPASDAVRRAMCSRTPLPGPRLARHRARPLPAGLPAARLSTGTPCACQASMRKRTGRSRQYVGAMPSRRIGDAQLQR